MMKFLEAARLFSDCWDLYRRYYNKELSDDVCDKLIDEMSVLHKKYGKQRMAKEMLLAIISEVQDIDDVRRRTKRDRR